MECLNEHNWGVTRISVLEGTSVPKLQNSNIIILEEIWDCKDCHKIIYKKVGVYKGTT